MDIQVSRFFMPAAIGLTTMAAFLVVRAVLFRVLHRWASRTESQADDIILYAVKGPSLFWAVAIGLHLGVDFSGIPEKQILYLTRLIHVLVIFSITVAVANLSGGVFKEYIRESSLPLPTTGLAYGIMKGLIYAIGILIILSVLGISITPLITALGVGGLAVALALQDTLANLFAGIHILMERSIRVGDFVRLESGQEGYIQDITWRTTRVRMLPNNMVIIPNSKMSQSIVTNYYLPDRKMAVQIPFGVDYASDPDRVERTVLEVAAKAMGEVPGLLADPAPVVRLIPGFGESSLDFTLVCHVREIADQPGVQHELRKRILMRFRAEGIDIPFPHRVVHVLQEREGKK